MLRTMRADLHIHTCLSPCADLKMSPSAIAERAKLKEIEILGICDHNSAENVPAMVKAARKFRICVLPGLEVTSQEEVHILALFDTAEAAFELQEIVYNHLPGENDEKAFGMQVVVNEKGEVLRFNKKLLIGASTLSVEKVVQAIHSLQGLAIASHIDREGFSLIGQLGFIPANLELDALEVSPQTSYQEAMTKFRFAYPLTFFSDAHFLEEVGRGFTCFYIEEGSTEEIKNALQNKEGRKIIH
jgi:PHP family Zn ribbon phosphoesterase